MAKSAPKAVGMEILAPPIIKFLAGKGVCAVTRAGSAAQTSSSQADSASGEQEVLARRKSAVWQKDVKERRARWGPKRAMSRDNRQISY
jgi:hypothetical protein